MKLPTRIKLKIAGFLYRLLRSLGVPQHQVIQRNDLSFHVDLSEGIDLSLFLFGSFQSHIGFSKHIHLPPNGIILDVGANIGAQTLPFAKVVPQGWVYAVEPTDYALQKLRKNIELNPTLAPHITIIPAFVSSQSAASSQLVAFASWKIDGSRAQTHPLHGGQTKASSAPQITLDQLVETQRIPKVHLIKIDTDGHELEVLQGARKTLDRDRPYIIFELSRYLFQERNLTFQDYEAILQPLNYDLRDSETLKKLHSGNLKRLIPQGGSIDVIAIPGFSTAQNTAQ